MNTNTLNVNLLRLKLCCGFERTDTLCDLIETDKCTKEEVVYYIKKYWPNNEFKKSILDRVVQYYNVDNIKI
jgi:hypothetical protein